MRLDAAYLLSNDSVIVDEERTMATSPIEPLADVVHALSPALSRYYLPAHVLGCATPTGAVFLDLKKNRYMGVGEEESRALLSLLRSQPNWRTNASTLLDASPSQDAEPIACELAKIGLLTKDPPQDAYLQQSPLAPQAPLMSVGEELEYDAKIDLLSLTRFLSACWSTRGALRAVTLYPIAQRIALAKRRLTNSSSAADREAILDITCRYRRLRPYFFTARNECLFHALSLVTFLLSFGLPANWVIGVRTKPWGAHSWAQYDNLILDSTPEKVYEYQPILTV